tara:strand:- start:5 stop:169 length:165 start_codon:yes stop_codon:yes gene_type:complete
MYPEVAAIFSNLEKSERDKDKWIHSKSLELIEKGFDSDEAFIIACKLYDEKKNT